MSSRFAIRSCRNRHQECARPCAYSTSLGPNRATYPACKTEWREGVLCKNVSSYRSHMNLQSITRTQEWWLSPIFSRVCTQERKRALCTNFSQGIQTRLQVRPEWTWTYTPNSSGIGIKLCCLLSWCIEESGAGLSSGEACFRRSSSELRWRGVAWAGYSWQFDDSKSAEGWPRPLV